jgi:hypothetical protein
MQRIKKLESIRGLASLSFVDYHLWLARIGLLGATIDALDLVRSIARTSISPANVR